MRDYTLLPTTTPAWKGNLPVGHLGTYADENGGKFGVAVTSFLQWVLRGNETAAEFFVGSGAAGDGWSVEERALDGIQVTPIDGTVVG